MEKKDYQDAIDVQSACNLSGVVTSFKAVLGKLWDEAHKDRKGTDWVNNHPISRMYAEQIRHLSSKTGYSEAYRECLKGAE